MATATVSTTPSAITADADDGGEFEFDLDISVIESGPVIPELLRSTSDNCGGTCASACTSCRS
jgi:FxLD family lantipeptide